MEVLYLLVPISLAIVGIGIALFMWAVKNGQMDDLERPGHSILYDDDEDMIPEDAKHDKARQPRRAGEPAQRVEPSQGRNQESEPEKPSRRTPRR